MKKLLYIILFCFAAFIVRGQVNVPTPPLITYTPMTAGGYAYKYMRADSGLAVPFRNLTTGRGVARPGAIVADAADSLLKYFNGLTWVTIGTGVIETYVDSISKVGDNLFYWEGGVGTGVALNKVDSIRQSEGTDSIWYFIGGDSTFVYRNISASGSVTEVTSSNSSITVANGTTTPEITLDTTLHHTYAYLQTVFAALIHTHPAADIVSGILPIARGGTGLGGIGSVGQQMRVAASGTALEYYTPTIGTGTVTNVSANYPLSVTSPTTTPVITLDTSLWKSLGYNDLRYQAIGDYSDDSAFVRHRNVSDDTLRLYRSNGDSSDVIFEVDAITLTTTGTSGAATLVDGVLNIPQYSGGGGGGTVTDFSAGDLSPVFTTTEATTTTTPALSFVLSNAAAHTFLGNNTGSSAAPAYVGITTADLPDLSGIYQPLDADLTSLAGLSAATGDVIYGSATNVWSKLAAGSNGDVLTLASGIPSWAAPAAGGSSKWEATGNDIYRISRVTIGSGAAPLARLMVNTDGIGIVQNDTTGILIANTTAATAGNPKYSPPLVLKGNGWNTGTVASVGTRWRIYNKTISGAFLTLSPLTFEISTDDGGTYTEMMNLKAGTTAGLITLGTTTLQSTGIVSGGTIAAASTVTGTSFISGVSTGFTSGTNTTNVYGHITGSVANSGSSTNTYAGFNESLTINNSAGTSTVRGFYYNPTNTNLTGTTSIGFQNTSGNNLFGTTSGSVGIGANSSIATSAILDITSTTKGLLLPRMTKAQRDAIASPVDGLIIYQTDNTAGVRFYEGGAWTKPTTVADP